MTPREITMSFRLFSKPQKPVGNPKLAEIQWLREEAAKQEQPSIAERFWGFFVGLMFLLSVVSLTVWLFWILTSVRDAIGPTCGEITIAFALAVLGLLARALWWAAQGQRLKAWRMFWFAGALALAATGWYTTPSVEKHRLLKATVRASMRAESYSLTAAQEPQRVDRIGMIETQEQAAIWEARWHSHVQRLKEPPGAQKERWHVLFYVLLVLGCGVCAVGVRKLHGKFESPLTRAARTVRANYPKMPPRNLKTNDIA